MIYEAAGILMKSSFLDNAQIIAFSVAMIFRESTILVFK